MKDLLSHIQTSGELSKYWNAVDKENDEARKAARRVERERKRVEMGSDYQSSDGEREENRLEIERLRKEMVSWDLEADGSTSDHRDEHEEEYGSL